MIDYEQLHSMAGQLVVPTAVQSFPVGGETAVKRVLSTCGEAFKAVDPSQLRGRVVIFSRVEGEPKIDRSSGRAIVNLTQLQSYAETGFAVEVDPSTGSKWAWQGHPQTIDVEQLRTTCVVFVHDNGNEKFFISTHEVPLPRIFPGEQSFFSAPNYATIADALAYYQQSMARQSSCEILGKMWHDNNRLFLKAKPEDTIQKSLSTYLTHRLGFDAEVMREQNVDDTHPVDIRITFHFANRVVLIEIKWLGKSKNADGSLTTEYSQSRAVDGARNWRDTWIVSLALRPHL